VKWLEDRGAIEKARRRTHRPGTVGRGVAAERLGAAGIATTSSDVVRLLGDRRLELRIVAARSLGKLGDPRSVSRLLDALEGARSVPQSLILMAIIHIGPSAVDPLVQGLGRKSTRARAVCVELLGIHGAIHAGKWLIAIAQHDVSLKVRVHAAGALGRLGMPGAVEPLVRLLAPSNEIVLRVAAARSLGQTGGKSALYALQTALDDDEVVVGRAAAEALTKLGKPGADVLARAVESATLGATRAEQWLARALIDEQARNRRTHHGGARHSGARHSAARAGRTHPSPVAATARSPKASLPAAGTVVTTRGSNR